MITPPVVRLRKRARLPGHGRPAVGVRRRARRTRTRSRTTRSSRSSTRRRTTPTRRAAGSSRCRSAQREATRLDPREPRWSLIELAHCVARARSSIVPAQDVLGLGSEARMNTPGHARRATGAGGCAAGSSPTSSRRGCGNRPRVAAIGSPRGRPHVAGAARRRLRRAARADGGARRRAARADRAGRAAAAASGRSRVTASAAS